MKEESGGQREEGERGQEGEGERYCRECSVRGTKRKKWGNMNGTREKVREGGKRG